MSVTDLTKQLFDPKNTFVSIDTNEGMFLAAMAVYRGDMQAKEIDQELLKLQDANSKVNYVRIV